MQTKEHTAIVWSAHLGLTRAVQAVAEIQDAAARTTSRWLAWLPGVPTVQKAAELHRKSIHSTISATSAVVAAVADTSLSAIGTGNGTSLFHQQKWRHTISGLQCAFGDSFASNTTTAALAPPMQLFLEDQPISVEQVPHHPRLVVILHGLAGHALQLTELADGLRTGSSAAVTVQYNTGRAVADNGAELADLLTQIATLRPNTKIALVGHSMGGLISRSALLQAECPTVSDLVMLGTPHRGAPLEKWSHWAVSALRIWPQSAPIASLGHSRSRGIKDLRFGTLLHDDWTTDPDDVLWLRDPGHQLPDHVRAHTVVAVLDESVTTKKARLVGDGMVRPASATRIPARPQDSAVTFADMGHISLINDPRAINHVKDLLAQRPQPLCA